MYPASSVKDRSFRFSGKPAKDRPEVFLGPVHERRALWARTTNAHAAIATVHAHAQARSLAVIAAVAVTPAPAKTANAAQAAAALALSHKLRGGQPIALTSGAIHFFARSVYGGAHNQRASLGR